MTNENLIAVLKTAQKEIATPQAYTMLEDTIATLRKEIAVKAAKSAGKQDLYRAMLAVIKSAEKHSPYQKALAKCNGHKLRGVECHLGGGHVADAEYLRIAVQATGSTTIHAENRIAGYDEENKCGYQVGELWFESEDGTVRALVLPMRWISADDSIGFTYKK